MISGSGIPLDSPAEPSRGGDAFAASHVEFETILRTLNTPVFVFDAQGNVVYVNDAVVRMLGVRDADEILGTHHAEMRTRFEILDADLNPLAPELAPSLRALRGEAVNGQLLRYRVMTTGAAGRASVAYTAL